MTKRRQRLLQLILLVVVLTIVITAMIYVTRTQPPTPHAKTATAPPQHANIVAPVCDQTLWRHTYHGRFATAKDRLRPIEDCVTVTGVLRFVRRERDGDVHMLLEVDGEFARLPNAKNKRGTLVVESECERKPTQADTVDEKACVGWGQHLYDSGLNGKRVAVTGAYVEDEQHYWREIHPATSINPL